MNLELKNISQIFSQKIALDNININFCEGKIHSLIGENGAGKSSLAAILCGDRSPAKGRILIDGKEVFFKNPRDAVEKGIVLVHQCPLLANSITVKENIFLGSENTKTSRRFLEPRVKILAKQWAPLMNMDLYVKDLSGDMRFYTALLCALSKNPKVLILDEPSVFLDTEQRKQLYSNLHLFAEQGNTVIVITHSMAEAKNYTDTVTALSKGKIIARYEDTSKFHEGSPGYFDFEAKWNENKNKILAELHTSSEPILLKKNTASAESFIAFKNVTVLPVNRPPLYNISFSAKSGEITLIRGHLESGLETLENLVTGMEENPCRGTVTLSSNCGIFQKTAFSLNLAKKRLNPAMLRGKNSNITAIIPSDRTFRSSNPTLTIEQLLTVYYTGKDTKAYAEKIIKKAQVAIKTEEKASSLSGGMLQRLILARELEQNPQFLILCEPMQGLDSIAQNNLCKRLADFAQSGKTVIVLSTVDFPSEICKKIYSLSDGELSE